jgi:hypothetical protein
MLACFVRQGIAADPRARIPAHGVGPSRIRLCPCSFLPIGSVVPQAPSPVDNSGFGNRSDKQCKASRLVDRCVERGKLGQVPSIRARHR